MLMLMSVAVISSEDNIRKTSVFVLLMLRVYVHAYVAAILTSVMLMLTAYAYKYNFRSVQECVDMLYMFFFYVIIIKHIVCSDQYLYKR